MNKIKLMIADESIEGAEAIKNYFQDLNNILVVGSFGDGNAVLNSLRVTEVDVLLVDLFMPFCDGMRVIEELKNNKDKYKIIYIVFYQG